MSLSSRQIRHLRGLSHALKAIVTIGNNGLTDNVLDELVLCLSHHELLKVRINVGDREKRDEIIQQIIQHTHAELVQRVGHVATYFRQNPDKPRVELGRK